MMQLLDNRVSICIEGSSTVGFAQLLNTREQE